MVQCIVGNKGKGKTKHMLECVRHRLARKKGSLIYLDKSKQHMYELDKSIRLIDVSEFPIEDTKGLIGFICGVLSQDHDAECVYLDSFLTISHTSPATVMPVMDTLEALSEQFDVDFLVSISADESALPTQILPYISVSL